MAANSPIRSLVCVLLVLFLGGQVLAIAPPGWQRDDSAQFCAMAVPSSTVLLTRGGNDDDHGCHRPSAPSLFTLVPRHGGECDPGRLAGTVECHVRHSLCTAGPRTGRSPPVIS